MRDYAKMPPVRVIDEEDLRRSQIDAFVFGCVIGMGFVLMLVMP